MKRLFAYELRD